MTVGATNRQTERPISRQARPSPSGRGLGEGETPPAANPGHPAFPDLPGFWIPAYAGMTAGPQLRRAMRQSAVDSRFRGNDGGGAGMTVE